MGCRWRGAHVGAVLQTAALERRAGGRPPGRCGIDVRRGEKREQQPNGHLQQQRHLAVERGGVREDLADGWSLARVRQSRLNGSAPAVNYHDELRYDYRGTT